MRKLNFVTLLFSCLLLMFLSEINFFKKTFFVMTRDYDTRFMKAYMSDQFSGFCSKESHGYVFKIKRKFNLDISPIIINFEKNRMKIPYWIFNKEFSKLDKEKVILLNFNQNNNFDFNNFIVEDNYQNKCFYLIRKKNGNS